MRLIYLVPIILIFGCATGKGITIKGADKIQAAEKIEAKVADTALVGANTQTKTTAHAGRDVMQSSGNTMNNDSSVMKDYIKLMQYIIWSLCGLVTAQFTAMIGLIGWVIKFLLRQGAKNDDFMEKMLGREQK
jgi:hypothetical protein